MKLPYTFSKEISALLLLMLLLFLYHAFFPLLRVFFFFCGVSACQNCLHSVNVNINSGYFFLIIITVRDENALLLIVLSQTFVLSDQHIGKESCKLSSFRIERLGVLRNRHET